MLEVRECLRLFKSSTAEVATLKIQLETDYMKVHLLSSTNCLHQPRENHLVKLLRFVYITTNSLFANCVMTNEVCKARPQHLPGGLYTAGSGIISNKIRLL